MEEISHNNNDLALHLKNAYEMLRQGAFSEAETALEGALSIDFENSEVQSALKSVHYWHERWAKYQEITDDFERAEYLLKQWKAFIHFLEKDTGSNERGVFALKQRIFGEALAHYLRLLESSSGSDPEILFRIGLCFKGKGNYKQALEYFEACSHQKVDDPQILVELADCYAFINEVKAAKAFFREAFFLDPQKINLNGLESLMIKRLVQRVEELGYSPPSLVEWIPVYGVLFGVLNVKRELRSLEYGKLKQSIFSFESRLEEEGKKENYIEPRLINRYFWLIDHYISSGDSRDKVDDVLKRLGKLNHSIYEQYIN